MQQNEHFSRVPASYTVGVLYLKTIKMIYKDLNRIFSDYPGE